MARSLNLGVFHFIFTIYSQEIVTFNTENGDSDSYMDARRAFSDAWHKARASLVLVFLVHL